MRYVPNVDLQVRKVISFIAKCVMPIAATMLLVASTAEAGILSGPIVNPANDHRYYLLSPSSWPDAETEAITVGGHLTTINDVDEQSWVFAQFAGYNNANYSLWIALNDAASEGDFVWSSGEPISYTYWAAGKPDNATGRDPRGEDYVHMFRLSDSRRGRWNDMIEDHTLSTHYPFAGVVEVVPEPGSLALIGFGAVMVLRRRRSTTHRPARN